MRFLKKLFTVIRTLLKINLFKTVYFNLKKLPLNKALKLPIHFYGKVDFVNLQGEFVINKETVNFGMIVFGGKHEMVISSNVATRIYNSGKIVFDGEAMFARGINIMVWNYGELLFGSNFSLGSLSRIICFRKITFKENVLISWEVQIVDTDFHFIVSDDKIKDNCGEVFIDRNVWIGSRSSILKKTFLPINSIVGSDSLCSGNYLEKYGDSILLAGVPAKMIRNNVSYLREKKMEMELLHYFNSNRNQEKKWQS